MKHFAIALALACSSAGAFEQPDVVGFHLATWHDKPGFCNFNPGLYLRWRSGLTIGTYDNSTCHQSFYAGRTWDWERSPFVLSLTIAAVSGYPGGPVLGAIPSVALPIPGRRDLSVRVAFIPRVEKRSANAIHLMLEHRF